MPRHHQQPFCDQFIFKERLQGTDTYETCGIPAEVRVLVNRFTKNFRGTPRVYHVRIGDDDDELTYAVCVYKQEAGVDNGNVNYNCRNMRVWVSISDFGFRCNQLYAMPR